MAGLPWLESFLLGAVLSPTDPVFAAAIVGREEIPYRLRNLLNVESGLNDGLALPIVVILLATASATPVHAWSLAGEVVGGVALGVLVPYAAIRLERTRIFSATTFYEPLNAFAVGLLVLALAMLTHANVFLAAFSAGITIATMSPALREAFHQFGELVAELLKLGALLVFGALISLQFLGDIGISGYVFAVLALFAARRTPVAARNLRRAEGRGPLRHHGHRAETLRARGPHLVEPRDGGGWNILVVSGSANQRVGNRAAWTDSTCWRSAGRRSARSDPARMSAA